MDLKVDIIFIKTLAIIKVRLNGAKVTVINTSYRLQYPVWRYSHMKSTTVRLSLNGLQGYHLECCYIHTEWSHGQGTGTNG